MASNEFSVGRDCQLVVMGPFGRVDLAHVTGFDSRQQTASIRVDRIDGRQMAAELPKGWEGMFELERGSSAADDFIARIRQVKRRGYAFEDEECDEGTRCVAAPIFNAEGRMVAAVGVAGPRARIRKSQVSGIAQTVTEAASKISQRMGFIELQPIYV